MNAIYLESNQVPATLRGSYTGKMFKANVVESVTIPSYAGLWFHGSRDHYSLIELMTGKQIPFPGQQSAPWDESRRDNKIDLKPGFAVVRHTIFCGKDMGLTFYIHPENAATLLPAPADDLSPVQKLVLKYTKERKASYNGRDRYGMAEDDFRYGGSEIKALGVESMPSRDEWNSAKDSLIAAGFLNKAGAITVKGRNAI